MLNLQPGTTEKLERSDGSNFSKQHQELEKWRDRNTFYYQSIEGFCKYLLQGNSNVLEIGSGLGYVLNAVNPKYGLGIDIDPSSIEYAKSKFPQLDFQVGDAECFNTDKDFEYILIINTLSSVDNIQKVLDNVNRLCHLDTRVVIVFHNPAWELILQFASLIGQRRPAPRLNWLSAEDIRNLLSLVNLEVVTHSKYCLLPKPIPVISWLVNKFIAPLPVVKDLCLNECIVARREPSFSPHNEIVNTLSCSVIIPARNEAGNIEDCITRMPQLGRHTEIIFIEGYSEDDTWEEMQRVQALYPDWDIKIVRQSGKGKGIAVRQGFAMATGDVLIILDSDLTVRPEDLGHFFNAVASNNCELANGCRLIYPLDKESMPWLNQLANRFFAWLLSYLLNIKIKDSLCGTKALSKENYQKIAGNRSYFGDFDPFGDFDLLFGAAKLNLKIKDVPVRYMPRQYGKSNISHFKEGLVLLKMCLFAARKIKFLG